MPLLDNSTDKLVEAVRDELELGRKAAEIKKEFVAAGWTAATADAFIAQVRAVTRDPAISLDTHNTWRDLLSGFGWVVFGLAFAGFALVAGFVKAFALGVLGMAYGAYLLGRAFYRAANK